MSSRESNNSLGLHRPFPALEVLDALHIRPVTPFDISSQPDVLCRNYPELAGDPDSYESGKPSWQGNWGWYKRFLKDQGIS